MPNFLQLFWSASACLARGDRKGLFQKSRLTQWGPALAGAPTDRAVGDG